MLIYDSDYRQLLTLKIAVEHWFLTTHQLQQFSVVSLLVVVFGLFLLTVVSTAAVSSLWRILGGCMTRFNNRLRLFDQACVVAAVCRLESKFACNM